MTTVISTTPVIAVAARSICRNLSSRPVEEMFDADH